MRSVADDCVYDRVLMIIWIDWQPLIRQNHACRDLVDEAKKFHLRPDLRTEMHGPRMAPRVGK